MTAQEIKTAVDNGKNVHWINSNYIVTKDNLNQYFVKCIDNNSLVGLTYKNGITLSEDENKFYILK
tara:strand:- start:159 stop:356 length:198 start_codon:yes stop_codon:yes gene_type:complete